MESAIHQTSIRKIYDLLKEHVKLGGDGILEPSQNPFFMQNADKVSFEDFQGSETPHNVIINGFAEEHNICFELKTMYLLIGNLYKEIYMGRFTFYTFDKIIKLVKDHEHFFDIGLQYAGLGYLNVLAFVPSKQKFFFRFDGGSNGFDREINYNKYKNYEPKDEELLSFDEMIEKIVG